MANDAIRKVEVRYSQSGQREVVRDLQAVGTESKKAAEGVDRLAKAQEQGRRVIDRTASDMKRVQRSYDRTAQSLDKTARAEANYARELQSIQKALDTELISAKRHNELMELSIDRYLSATLAANSFGKELAATNDNLRLTSTQLLNLTRQGGDVATMFAMGASPMQVFASQAAQIYDAIASGPGGLTGGLKALGRELTLTATRFAPIGLAAGAAAGAAYLVWKAASGPEVKSAEEALDRYKRTLDDLKAGYEDAADAAERFFDRPRNRDPDGEDAKLRHELQGLVTRRPGRTASHSRARRPAAVRPDHRRRVPRRDREDSDRTGHAGRRGEDRRLAS